MILFSLLTTNLVTAIDLPRNGGDFAERQKESKTLIDLDSNLVTNIQIPPPLIHR